MRLNLSREQEFVVKEIWILAWNASVQRANLYNKKSKVDNKTKSKFRASIISYVEDEIFQSYKDGCSENQHYKNIESLIAKANSLNLGILGPEGYKFGVAQKLLNLSLKYMWCLGHIAEPPHCPVDRIIINKTNLKGKVNWTDIKDRNAYEAVIDEIKKLSSAKSITPSRWELLIYTRR